MTGSPRTGGVSGTFGVLLAAGTSSRWPSGPKLLARFDGRTLLRRACDALARSEVADAVAVLGSDADQLEPECRAAGVRAVRNPDFALGQSTSLRVGIDAAPSEVSGFLLTVADQPLLTHEHLDQVITVGERTNRITCVRAEGRRGAPAWFPARLREDLISIEGDRGARLLIDAAGEDLDEVELPAGALFDVDRPEDLDRLTAHLERREHLEPLGDST